VPTFCRHNRFIDRCPICSPRTAAAGAAGTGAGAEPRRPRSPRSGSTGAAPRTRSGLRVSHEARAQEDGYSNPLVPGLHASADARRLAEEIARSVGRLGELATDPPGLYSEVATADDLERATWLAFLIAYVGPLDDVEDPFAEIAQAAALAEPGGAWQSTSHEWLEAVTPGVRNSLDGAGGSRALDAYRAWVGRAGSQQLAFTGDPAWTAQRRFDRIYERLALPGLTRDARYDLLVTLGRLDRYELRAQSLHLRGDDRVTRAAKRVFGIGDAINLQRRSGELAVAAAVPIESLDLALFNWLGPDATRLGASESAFEPQLADRVAGALGL
jgi:hypothetical protein